MSALDIPVQSHDQVLLEIDEVDRALSRRRVPKFVSQRDRADRQFSNSDRRFLRAAAAVLIPATPSGDVRVDVLANIERMLGQASVEHQIKARRIVEWARRISIFYGRQQMPVRARQSRFIVVQKLAHAVSSLCLVAFWADEATLSLIDRPVTRP